MLRSARLFVCVCAVAAAATASGNATGAQRMYVGFQDDPSFRFRENRKDNLEAARRAGATIIRTEVTWAQVAATKPANPSNPFDPAYAPLASVDDLVREAQRRGIEVLLTIYGTPGWANGGQRPNRPPTNLRDITDFCRAVAERYSGRYPGYPFVRFYSFWNEPNLEQFLAPQFNSRGASVGPQTYARMFKAAYAGIKAGSPNALVAIGETSARGRDRPTPGGVVQDSHSPGRFVELVAKTEPNLRFDAWSHHPFPSTPGQPPNENVRFPNVNLTMLPRFEKLLDTSFKRKDIPVWLTEYGHETRPQEPRGVTYTQQATYARQALNLARADARVPIFIWFVVRDDPSNPWQSGLLTESGEQKPAFSSFAAVAKALDARNAILYVKAGRRNPTVRFSAIEIAAASGAGEPVGLTYRVIFKKTVVAVEQPVVRVDRDGWMTLRLAFTPEAKHSYTLSIDGTDTHGNRLKRTLTLVAVR